MKWILVVVALANGDLPHSRIIESSGLVEKNLVFNSLKECQEADPMGAIISDDIQGQMMCLAVDLSKSKNVK
jgi:hypothetical protein